MIWWAASLLALAAIPSDLFAQTFTGTVPRIQDGDTFDLCDAVACHRIRICGIDAPERGQPGSREATDKLRDIVKDKAVQCTQVGSGTVCDGRSQPTNRNRYVAQCFIEKDDIADAMVATPAIGCGFQEATIRVEDKEKDAQDERTRNGDL